MFWLFLPALAAAGFFTEHVEKYLNSDIDPCDDFYGHVCTAAVAEDRLLAVDGPQRYHNLIKQLTSPKIREFRSLIENNTFTPSSEELIDQSSGMEPIDSRVTHNPFVTEFDDCPTDLRYVDATRFLEAFEAYDAHYRLQSSPHYNTLRNKITDIFTVQKNILINEFAKAPWTRKHADLVDFLKNLPLHHLEVKSFPMEEYTDNMRSRYENCLRITTDKTAALSKRCTVYAVCQIRQKLLEDIHQYVRKAFRLGAWYYDIENYVILSPVFYTLEDEDLPYMMGSLDIVISHEIGHVFFNGKAVPANSECFRKHMKRTCRTYLDEVECSKYDRNTDGFPAVRGNYSRLDDDASDWIGMYAGLKALRQYFPETSFNGLPHSSEITKSAETLKKFFYANAISLCTKISGVSDSYHSPPKVRVNGIASLFPEFSDAFQCKRGSKMAKASTCLPFAGEGAPAQKRYGHL